MLHYNIIDKNKNVYFGVKSTFEYRAAALGLLTHLSRTLCFSLLLLLEKPHDQKLCINPAIILSDWTPPGPADVPRRTAAAVAHGGAGGSPPQAPGTAPGPTSAAAAFPY